MLFDELTDFRARPVLDLLSLFAKVKESEEPVRGGTSASFSFDAGGISRRIRK
jgi:hypothetical protein